MNYLIIFIIVLILLILFFIFNKQQKDNTSFSTFKNNNNCEIDWSDWSNCSSSCGNGIQARYSYIKNGPEGCSLPQVQTKNCNSQSCLWTYIGCFNDYEGTENENNNNHILQYTLDSTTLKDSLIEAQNKGYDIIGCQDNICYADKISNYPTDPTFYAKLGYSTACNDRQGLKYVNAIYKLN